MARPAPPPGTVTLFDIVGRRRPSAAAVARLAGTMFDRLCPAERLAATRRLTEHRMRRSASAGLWPHAQAVDVWAAVGRGDLTPMRGPWGVAFDRGEVKAYAAANPMRRPNNT